MDITFRVRLVGNRDGVEAVHRVPPPAVTVGPDFAVPAGLLVGAGPRVAGAVAVEHVPGPPKSESGSGPLIGLSSRRLGYGVRCSSRTGTGCSLVATVTAAACHRSLPRRRGSPENAWSSWRAELGIICVSRVSIYQLREHSGTCWTVEWRPSQWPHLILPTVFALRRSGVRRSAIVAVTTTPGFERRDQPMTAPARSGHLLLPPSNRLPPHPRKGFKARRTQLTDEISRLYRFVDEYTSLFPDGYADLATQAARLDERVRALKEQKTGLEREVHSVESSLKGLQSKVVQTEDALILQEVGVYDYTHPMESSAEYKKSLTRIRNDMKSMVKDGFAVESGVTTWTVDGSVPKGKKMVRDMSKLLLRAYNNEASTLVAKLRPFRLEAALKRLETSRNVINRLGAQPMQIKISRSYHRLRREELRLTADWLAKKAEEKEEAKAERQRLREEARARRELEAEKKRLFKERNQYRTVLAKLRDAGADDDDQEVAELVEKLSEIGDALLTVEDRAANRQAGYVYVISNVGSFGENMVKIGMTRRLEPSIPGAGVG